MTTVTQCPYFTSVRQRSLLCLLLLTFGLLAAHSAMAQSAKSSATPAECHVKVVANEVVVSNQERVDVGYHVEPPGIIPGPGEWPYFAWSDTPLGVARARDGSGYLFFGSDGGCHRDCVGAFQRWGSITRSRGTLDHPLGTPVDDPHPAPVEFLLPTSSNLPASVDYVGGGPVYRVPDGEPGAGSLLLAYHAERNANPFWSWTGLATSTDEGLSWQDLGLVLSGPQPYTAEGAMDIGSGTLVPYTDPATSQKFFYIFFPQHCWTTSTATCKDFTYLSVARAPYEQLLIRAMEDSSVTGLFNKYFKGNWDQPGMSGKADELFPGVTGETDGGPEVVWSAYRNRFVIVMDNSQYIAYGESEDGLYWPPMQVIFGTNPQIPVYAYANAVGSGDDPGILGKTFYSYYTEFSQGDSWQPASVNRLTVTTECGSSGAEPASPNE